MAIRNTIRRVLRRGKEIGMSILRRGLIKDSPANRERIKRFQDLREKRGVPPEFLEKMRRRMIKELETY